MGLSCSKCQLIYENCTCEEDQKVEREERIIELLEEISKKLTDIRLFEENKFLNRKIDIEIAQARRQIE